MPEGSTNHVIKIGQTEEYAPPIFKFLKLAFPREKVSKILVKMLGPEFKIYPDEDYANNGVAEHLLIKSYFGNDEEALRAREDRSNPWHYVYDGNIQNV